MKKKKQETSWHQRVSILWTANLKQTRQTTRPTGCDMRMTFYSPHDVLEKYPDHILTDDVDIERNTKVWLWYFQGQDRVKGKRSFKFKGQFKVKMSFKRSKVTFRYSSSKGQWSFQGQMLVARLAVQWASCQVYWNYPSKPQLFPYITAIFLHKHEKFPQDAQPK